MADEVYRWWGVALMAALCASPCGAEVVASGDDYFRLRHEARSTLAPAKLWQRLIVPSRWWHPDHTYSGDAANLTLDPTAGGLWREDWPAGSVAHGEVLLLREGEQLRLDAPFGPLQGLGARSVWTITLEADGTGTQVVFDEVAIAAPGSGMAEMAKAVDFVKAEALRRLVGDPTP